MVTRRRGEKRPIGLFPWLELWLWWIMFHILQFQSFIVQFNRRHHHQQQNVRKRDYSDPFFRCRWGHEGSEIVEHGGSCACGR